MPDENKMSIEKYISDRLDDQIKYYDLKSIEYKKKHENISLATIITQLQKYNYISIRFACCNYNSITNN